LRQRGWLHHNRAFPLKSIFAGLMLLAAVHSILLILADQVFRGGSALAVPEERVSLLIEVFILWFLIFLAWTLGYAVALSRRRAQRFELESSSSKSVSKTLNYAHCKPRSIRTFFSIASTAYAR
jgi:hypothetical protein